MYLGDTRKVEKAGNEFSIHSPTQFRTGRHVDEESRILIKLWGPFTKEALK